ncbi:MAG: hypothetical protein LBI82_00300, partial [Dysgonamonadaceae bacterium]|nr:hypothetical protein [Dysgonamonadaceae bacterium]
MYTKTFKYALLLIACLAISSISCKKDERGNPGIPGKSDLKEGTNLTIFAFNNGIRYKKEFTLVDENSVSSLVFWINNLDQD